MDATPVIARGHNLAVITPPVPAAAVPLLQAIPASRSILVLTADADHAVQLDAALDRAGSVAVSGLARAQRKLAAARPPVLFVSAADALALLGRSALAAATYETVVLAWPEQLDEDGRDALQSVMAEVSRDSQRIILAALTDHEVDALIDRYAFRAVTFGFPPAAAVEDAAAGAPPPPRALPSPASSLGPASFVVARASRLDSVRRLVYDALDPERDDAIAVVPCPASREAAEALARPGGGSAAPRLVFVVEPCQLAWLRSLFAPLTPLRIPTSLDLLERRSAQVRARLTRTLETESLDRELFLLGPLLERFDPAELAAAALHLATSGGHSRRGEGAGPLAAESPGRDAGGEGGEEGEGRGSWTKLWIGVGRKDNVRPGDVLGAIVGEAKLPADHVGRIELRELYALVEVRSDDAERVTRALTGTTLRGRRLTARVDRGHAPPSPSPASPRRGPGGSAGTAGA